MEMKADTDRVLMSEALRGRVPELDGESQVAPEVLERAVTVVAQKRVGDKATAMVGVLHGIQLGQEVEVEFRCELAEALDVLEAEALSFGDLELHRGARVVVVKGPFLVKAARLDGLSFDDPLCTLGLHLARSARAA